MEEENEEKEVKEEEKRRRGVRWESMRVSWKLFGLPFLLFIFLLNLPLLPFHLSTLRPFLHERMCNFFAEKEKIVVVPRREGKVSAIRAVNDRWNFQADFPISKCASSVCSFKLCSVHENSLLLRE